MAKKKNEEKPKVHKDLEGFEISINEFGEITTNVKVDKINEFLNENVEDKKLTGQDDGDPFHEEIDPEDTNSEDENLFTEEDESED